MSESLFERGQSQAKKLDVVQPTAPLFADCPYLYDCLRTRVSDKNVVIKGCTIRLGFHLTDLQICITDEHHHLYAYAVLDPFKTLSEAVEEVLSSGSINWQASRGKRQ